MWGSSPTQEATEADVVRLREYRNSTGFVIKRCINDLNLSITEKQAWAICKGLTWDNVGGPIEKIGVDETSAGKRLRQRIKKRNYKKLTDKQILKMRQLRHRGLGYTDIKERLNLTTAPSTISRICRGKLHQDVGGPIEKRRHLREKLSEEQVVKLRRMVKKTSSLTKAIKQLNLDIGLSACHSLVTGKTWKHVGGPIKGKDYD